MGERVELVDLKDGKSFRQYYYLKEELVSYCKKNGIPSNGSKIELSNRIEAYLDKKEYTVIKETNSAKRKDDIYLDSIIEENIKFSEKHRAFFKQYLGESFSFNVKFQQWLKSNAGKKYSEAITAYKEILEDKKHNKYAIEKQFEYNIYIRDFFEDNKNLKLEDAIKCWKYKKSIKGTNKYEKGDLIALK